MSYGNPLGTYNGYGSLRFVETDIVGDPWEDWSQVRSPSRAIRRLRRGFKQRIVTRYKANGKAITDEINNVVYIHPHDAIRLRAALKARASMV